MFVLLSNDDGIEAPGLMALAKELAPKYEVVVVAPDRERSASSHAITVHKPLRVRQINANLNIKQAYAVNGTPSDCVKLALTTLLPKQPDIVISGINRGSNLGTDVFYSGTVAAALEGLLHGIPGIAVSLATSSGDSESDYSLAAQVALLVVERLANKPNIPRMLININVPDLPRNMIRGIRITRLGMRRYRNVFETRRDPRGQTYYWLAGEPVAEVDEIDTDIAAIEDGYISLTPITVDLTDYGAIKQLQAWEKEFDI